VLQSKTYKNSGTALLFKFLGYCLMGLYEEAGKWLPNKIMLLYNSSVGDDIDEETVVQRSAFRGYSQTPIIISEGETRQVKVTYSFEVPRAAIGGKFNQIALYGAGISAEEENGIKNFSAYYYLKDAFGALEDYDPSTWLATTVLLVDWELTISNKG
jgi:hypothetical protein